MTGVTLRDVALLAGVNAATASRALDPAKQRLVSEATRERVIAAARQLGYKGNAMARGLRKGRSGTIGIAVADLGNPFIAPVVRGIENAVEAHDLLPLIAESQDRHDRLTRVLEHFVERRVDVAIVTSARLGDAKLLKAIAQSLPIVLAVRTLPGSDYPMVTHDDVLAGRMAARHLVDLGHRHIVQLPGPSDVSSFVRRVEGFSAELAAAGVQEAAPPPAALTPSVAEGRRLMQYALESGDVPTAVFAHNDLMAVGAIEAIRSVGLRCPDDISVVGCNDSPLTDHIEPPLTTVGLPGYQLGRMAADLALNLIADPNTPGATLTVRPTLVVRRSSGEAPALARGRHR